MINQNLANWLLEDNLIKAEEYISEAKMKVEDITPLFKAAKTPKDFMDVYESKKKNIKSLLKSNPGEVVSFPWQLHVKLIEDNKSAFNDYFTKLTDLEEFNKNIRKDIVVIFPDLFKKLFEKSAYEVTEIFPAADVVAIKKIYPDIEWGKKKLDESKNDVVMVPEISDMLNALVIKAKRAGEYIEGQDDTKKYKTIIEKLDKVNIELDRFVTSLIKE